MNGLAIGTGKIATIAEIIEVHKTIASLLYHDTSVADNNAPKRQFFTVVIKLQMRVKYGVRSVDGLLVGGKFKCRRV